MFRAFLSRHWGLDAAEVQANNFVFFSAYYSHLRSGALAVGSPWGGAPLAADRAPSAEATEEPPWSGAASQAPSEGGVDQGGGGQLSGHLQGGAGQPYEAAPSPQLYVQRRQQLEQQQQQQQQQQRNLVEAHREAQRRIAQESWGASAYGAGASPSRSFAPAAVVSPPWVSRVASPRDSADLEDGGSAIAAAARARRAAGRPDGDPWLEQPASPSVGGMRHALRMRRD